MSGPAAFLNGRVTLHAGDCRAIVRELRDASIDSVVSDPPYALVSIVRRFGGASAAPARDGDVYARSSAGFMGQRWDTGEVAFDSAFWEDILRVLKPGGHVIAMAGTRTYHRLACAIEDAGFEIRDQIAWCYGTGFPKSHNAGGGWGTALKPAWEPIVLARKPLIGAVAENVLAHGTGAINVDGCRVEGSDNTTKAWRGAGTRDREQYRKGTSGKPVHTDVGRWPANIVHDGSDEVLAAFPEAPGQQRAVTGAERAKRTVNAYGDFGESRDGMEPRGDSGSAARFFYSAKADADDRLGSKHPTVKPVSLMQWLCRLVTPTGGVVLDPFAGTGTTGEAAWREGFSAILIEREAEYQADIARRMSLCSAGPATRRAESAKARAREVASPLFDHLN
ncbi:site-specific DNA-methyltransferase [Hansschlegelia sp.]|uniref:DNA-methyltransferase n=1 Tax=Hansschlegelia sp. TaxID=2041892 RepID=UPI002BF7975B|nr:site-specific DNA-methyltransferase [Hansschlegelia sp.]HVI27505.1 site-specific DNA-methyltransferase [Hansschlegelia sp.]